MNNTKDRIDFLEHQLYEARGTVIDLMSEEKQRLLRSYRHCVTRDDTYGWLHGVANQLVDMAEPLPREHQQSSDRARCPLCGGGALSWYGDEGFTLPEGLRRHLVGWGNNRQCPVTTVASEFARDYWEGKFRKAEQLEEIQQATRIKDRKRSETLYAVARDREPVLIDEGLRYGMVARNDADLAWAEQRLVSLGFRIDVQDKAKSYIDEQEAYVVYADLRAEGELYFRVYRQPTAGTLRPCVRSFRIPDNWKNDLPAKYRQRVAKELGH